MKRSFLLITLAMCLMLTGCGWFDGSYVSVTPHWEPHQNTQSENLSASDYPELIDALQEMVSKTTESAPIIVADYKMGSVEQGMEAAVEYLKNTDPIGAYAIEEITYELGTSGSLPALAVTISYRHTRAEIQRIRRVKDVAAAQKAIAVALESHGTGVVLYVDSYAPTDFTQLVQDHGVLHPDLVMETPQVTEVLYGTGRSRVLELVFSYQFSRDALRQMKMQVRPVFEAAGLYVSGSGEPHQKFEQLFGFLMERFDYSLDASITPAYSLLCHGVGDSRAFATVYAAMCRGAGLDCRIVTGTRNGEPYTWNMVMDNGTYYHVDLLESHAQGSYSQLRDWEMEGYVWDYSAYPTCDGAVAEEPAPTEEAVTEETE